MSRSRFARYARTGCPIWRKNEGTFLFARGWRAGERMRDCDSCQQMRDAAATSGAPNAPNYTRRARCIRLGEHGNSGEVHRT